jgi:hypothetical protein
MFVISAEKYFNYWIKKVHLNGKCINTMPLVKNFCVLCKCKSIIYETTYTTRKRGLMTGNDNT